MTVPDRSREEVTFIPKAPRTKAAGTRATRNKRRGLADELAAAKAVVRERSQGLCEVKSVACSFYGEHVHHRLRRSQRAGHDPDLMCLACRCCHDLLHANVDWAKRHGLIVTTGYTGTRTLGHHPLTCQVDHRADLLTAAIRQPIGPATNTCLGLECERPGAAETAPAMADPSIEGAERERS